MKCLKCNSEIFWKIRKFRLCSACSYYACAITNNEIKEANIRINKRKLQNEI